MDPAIGSAIVSGGLDLLGGALGMSSAASEAQKQRKFAKHMAKNAIQYRVKDLEKAGLNPMLAVMGAGGLSGAQVPSLSASRGGDFSGVGSRAVSAYQSAKLIKSQTENIAADTALKSSTAVKTAAEAKILQDQGLFSAQSAEYGRDKLGFEVSKLQEEIRSLEKTQKLQDIDINDVKPLAIEAARLINRAKELGLSEQQATAKLWEELGSIGKGAQFILPLLRILLSRGYRE